MLIWSFGRRLPDVAFSGGGPVDDFAGASDVNHATTAIRLERGLDARLVSGVSVGRLVLDGLDHVAARRKLAQLRWQVFPVPGHDACATGHMDDSQRSDERLLSPGRAGT
jgi:hypothetical protein